MRASLKEWRVLNTIRVYAEGVGCEHLRFVCSDMWKS